MNRIAKQTCKNAARKLYRCNSTSHQYITFPNISNARLINPTYFMSAALISRIHYSSDRQKNRRLSACFIFRRNGLFNVLLAANESSCSQTEAEQGETAWFRDVSRRSVAILDLRIARRQALRDSVMRHVFRIIDVERRI